MKPSVMSSRSWLQDGPGVGPGHQPLQGGDPVGGHVHLIAGLVVEHRTRHVTQDADRRQRQPLGVGELRELEGQRRVVRVRIVDDQVARLDVADRADAERTVGLADDAQLAPGEGDRLAVDQRDDRRRLGVLRPSNAPSLKIGQFW